MRFVTKLLVLVFSLLPAAFAFEQPITSSSSSVKVLNISPDLLKPLYIGDKTRIKVDVEYLMSEDSGTVTLVIQKGKSGGSPLENITEVVLKGKGKLTLESEIIIPNTRALQIFTALSHQGDASTSIVDSRVYKVVKKKKA